jgi:hypothetical protein
MFNTLTRSWTLAKASWQVLRQDPELALFPAIAFATLLVVAGGFVGIGFGVSAFDLDKGINLQGAVLVALYYFVMYFIIIYFQVALVCAVRQRLAGGNPNLASGVRQANQRLGAIASWALVSALVGLILKALEAAAEHSSNTFVRIGGQIAVAVIGVAWSLAAFFVIPVIAAEGVGGLAALRRSASVVKQRWGEAVVGQAGVALVIWILAAIVGVAFFGIGISLVVSGGWIGVGVGYFVIAAGVVVLAVIISAGAALQSIYTTVLYDYATAGRSAQQFGETVLARAFNQKVG